MIECSEDTRLDVIPPVASLCSQWVNLSVDLKTYFITFESLFLRVTYSILIEFKSMQLHFGWLWGNVTRQKKKELWFYLWKLYLKSLIPWADLGSQSLCVTPEMSALQAKLVLCVYCGAVHWSSGFSSLQGLIFVGEAPNTVCHYEGKKQRLCPIQNRSVTLTCCYKIYNLKCFTVD